MVAIHEGTRQSTDGGSPDPKRGRGKVVLGVGLGLGGVMVAGGVAHALTDGTPTGSAPDTDTAKPSASTPDARPSTGIDLDAGTFDPLQLCQYFMGKDAVASAIQLATGASVGPNDCSSLSGGRQSTVTTGAGTFSVVVPENGTDAFFSAAGGWGPMPGHPGIEDGSRAAEEAYLGFACGDKAVLFEDPTTTDPTALTPVMDAAKAAC